jgi:hypothetical protein
MERTSKSGEKQPTQQNPPVATVSAKTHVKKCLKLDVIYDVDGELVRTNQLLQDNATPIGVIVPFTAGNQQKKELIVYYDDEHSMLSLRDAKIFAWYSLPCYQGCHWRIKSASDDARMKKLLPQVNELCRKLGGKSINGKYIDGDAFDQLVTPKHKIRYVCDIL